MAEVIELNLNDVTGEQLWKMRHAIGLGRSKKPYRNYYYVSRPDIFL